MVVFWKIKIGLANEIPMWNLSFEHLTKTGAVVITIFVIISTFKCMLLLCLSLAWVMWVSYSIFFRRECLNQFQPLDSRYSRRLAKLFRRLHYCAKQNHLKDLSGCMFMKNKDFIIKNENKYLSLCLSHYF
jgi:hypothetical protein